MALLKNQEDEEEALATAQKNPVKQKPPKFVYAPKKKKKGEGFLAAGFSTSNLG